MGCVTPTENQHDRGEVCVPGISGRSATTDEQAQTENANHYTDADAARSQSCTVRHVLQQCSDARVPDPLWCGNAK